MNYYRRYCGDYARDTGHLTLEEHGAFTILLDHQYATEKPLPEDFPSLFRICRAYSKSEKESVRKVVDNFFPKCNGGRGNKRAIKQIPKERKAIDSAIGRAKDAAEKRWTAQRLKAMHDAPSNAPSITTSNAQAMPSLSHSVLKEEKDARTRSQDENRNGESKKIGVYLKAVKS